MELFVLTVPPAFVCRYYNWSTAAPVMLAMQVYQKPLPQVKPTDTLHFFERFTRLLSDMSKFRNRLEHMLCFPNLNLQGVPFGKKCKIVLSLRCNQDDEASCVSWCVFGCFFFIE